MLDFSRNVWRNRIWSFFIWGSLTTFCDSIFAFICVFLLFWTCMYISSIQKVTSFISSCRPNSLLPLVSSSSLQHTSACVWLKSKLMDPCLDWVYMLKIIFFVSYFLNYIFIFTFLIPRLNNLLATFYVIFLYLPNFNWHFIFENNNGWW